MGLISFYWVLGFAWNERVRLEFALEFFINIHLSHLKVILTFKSYDYLYWYAYRL